MRKYTVEKEGGSRLDRLDMTILYLLLDYFEAVSGMTAVTQEKIYGQLDSGIGKSTLHRRLAYIINYGYIARGFSESRFNTYYITAKGKQKLKEAFQ